ncbi:MAG: hypothetical protein GF331_20115 [Chitinivibrionales bacterium]|nr:hypothetical protein [Chitinivibrionales bacterium]
MELIVTMVVMGVAVGFIGAAYVVAMRTWSANGNALESIRVAGRIRRSVHERLTRCTSVVRRTPRSWLLVHGHGDTARMEYRAGTLRVGDTVLNTASEISAFSVDPGPSRWPTPVVAVRMAVRSHGTSSELAWRAACRGDDDLPDRIPRPSSQQPDRTGLYWER